MRKLNKMIKKQFFIGYLPCFHQKNLPLRHYIINKGYVYQTTTNLGNYKNAYRQGSVVCSG